jgi:hypothetical protein
MNDAYDLVDDLRVRLFGGAFDERLVRSIIHSPAIIEEGNTRKKMAGREGFEPSSRLLSLVLETSALNRSAIFLWWSPQQALNLRPPAYKAGALNQTELYGGKYIT